MEAIRDCISYEGKTTDVFIISLLLIEETFVPCISGSICALNLSLIHI